MTIFIVSNGHGLASHVSRKCQCLSGVLVWTSVLKRRTSARYQGPPLEESPARCDENKYEMVVEVS